MRHARPSPRRAGFTLLELSLALAATAALLLLAASAVREADAARARTAARTAALAQTEDALQALRDDLAACVVEALAVSGAAPATTFCLALREPVPAVVTWGPRTARWCAGHASAGAAAPREPDVRPAGVVTGCGLAARAPTVGRLTAPAPFAPSRRVEVQLFSASGAPLAVHVRLRDDRADDGAAPGDRPRPGPTRCASRAPSARSAAAAAARRRAARGGADDGDAIPAALAAERPAAVHVALLRPSV
ncbi:MAG: prepilin-type N-terminal cleavage/methylation domain-containing protein [bacterium]|nr:prepilin-type N-terminal cleavage/methylation domain-containing protein [bacterium]